ncbi:unnamed protein product, partial [Ectocarpus sp. 13 AM-2016]
SLCGPVNNTAPRVHTALLSRPERASKHLPTSYIRYGQEEFQVCLQHARLLLSLGVHGSTPTCVLLQACKECVSEFI